MVVFDIKSINRYINTQETHLERLEKHELQRCSENNFSIYEFKINNDSRAVDVQEDLDFVRNKIKEDTLIKKYINHQTS